MPAEIVDIHVPNDEYDVTAEIVSGLSRAKGHKTLPTILLYDERGLRLYDAITVDAKEYYLFKAEEDILLANADEIVRTMHGATECKAVPDEVVLELGAGALRKTSHILRSLARLKKDASDAPITYYALDLEQKELIRTLDEIAMSDVGKQLAGKVDTKGMWGTYDDGLRFVRAGGLRSASNSSVDRASAFAEGGLLDEKLENAASRIASPLSDPSESATESSVGPVTPPSVDDTQQEAPLHILFLGSSLGNFSRKDASGFLKSLPLRPESGDTLLIGLDHDNDKTAIEEAYNDKAGFTRSFIMNGLKAAGRAMGDENLFDESNWEYFNKYSIADRRHEAFIKSKKVQFIEDPKSKQKFSFDAGELLKFEESCKYSDTDAYRLFTGAQLRPIQRWSDPANKYSLWLLEKAPINFDLLPSLDAEDGASRFGVPTRDDWAQIWKAWDLITLEMIPPELLYQKPIDLRHICLFYIGHIPTFLDIQLSKVLGGGNTEPSSFQEIFERGIDPNVDDPTKCHPHSEVPAKEEDWPSLSALLDFRDRVRERLLKFYDDIDSGAQQLTRRAGRVLFMSYEHEALHAETLLYMLLQSPATVPPPGFAVPPWESLAKQWNSAPTPRGETVNLGPATVTLGHDDDEKKDETESALGHEYGWDNENPKRQVSVGEFRIEWRPITNGQFYEFYKSEGKDKVALPTSWVELDDGTVQVRTFFGPIPMKLAWEWPVFASYDALSTYAIVKGGRLPTEPELRLFLDKFEMGYEGGANVGFRNWHPVPATTGVESKRGVGTNGGVWEWTSTVFDRVEGFEPSELYPGYSADFFDGCHNVVMGGSYATIPRISERRSVRNWYQRNYGYAFVGGRVVYDVQK